MLIADICEHATIRFDDRSYRWIDIKRFSWLGEGEDRALLAALIANPRYRDTYLAPDSHEQDAETIHGPYQVAAIKPDDFERIEPAAVRAVLGEFLNLCELPDPEALQEIDSSIHHDLRGAVWYRLRRVAHAEHELSFILLEFRELVAICHQEGTLTLIVMAID